MPLPVINPNQFSQTIVTSDGFNLTNPTPAVYPFHRPCPVCHKNFNVGDRIINSSYPIKALGERKPANVHDYCALAYDDDKFVSCIYAPNKSFIIG